MRASLWLTNLWQQRTARERHLITIAVIAGMGYLGWTWVWQPSLRTLQAGPSLQAQAMRDLRVLENLASVAKSWQAKPDLSTATALSTASEISQALGASAQVSGNVLKVEVQNWSAATLSQWWQRIEATQAGRISNVDLAQGEQGWTGHMSLTAGTPP